MARGRQSRIRDTELSALIDLVYRAALEPEEWPAFLGAMTKATGSELTCLLLLDDSSGAGEALWQYGVPADAQREYPHWVPFNPYARAQASAMSSGALVRGDMLVRRAELLASGFYNDYLCRFAKVADSIGVCLLHEGDRLAYLASHRDVAKPDYGPWELEIHAALLRHLQRAIAIQRRLGTLELCRSVGEHALDRLPAAVFFLARDGTVLFHNAEARRLVATGDLSLTREGRIEVAGRSAGQFLARAVAEACRTGTGDGLGAGETFHLPRDEGKPYGVVVSPLRGSRLPLLPSPPAAVVLVTDPDRPLEATGVLERLYGLTAAEARLACLVASGRTLQDATDVLGITLNTARWTLKNVFAKTDTTRQAELVRLLLTGPAAIQPSQ
jgi:DNA-binding CsgD family transcriptional regulator